MYTPEQQIENEAERAPDAAPPARARFTLRRRASAGEGAAAGGLRAWWVPCVVLLAGVALSAGLSRWAAQENERSARLRFDNAATNASSVVEKRFGAYVEVLQGLRALFHTGEVQRDGFRRYAEALDLAHKYPGFQVLSYAPYVRPEDKLAFESAVRQDPALAPALQQRFAITPPGERAAGYHPLTLVEPLHGNEKVLGKDMAAVPGVREALERMRDSGHLGSSGRTIQNTGPGAHIGLALRLPVYRVGMPIDSLEQRRAAFIGSVGAGVRVTAMLSGLDLEGAALRLRLYDGGPQNPGSLQSPAQALRDDKLLFDTEHPDRLPAAAEAGKQQAAAGDAKAQQLLRHVQAFSLGGRWWLVEASATPSDVADPLQRALPAIILAGGVTISALLAGVLLSLTGSQRRAVALARQMTQSLRTSERRLAEAQGLAKVGSWVLDLETGEIECSREARRIYGFTAGAPKPRLTQLLALVPSDDREAVREAVDRASEYATPSEVEHQLQLADGTRRWVHANFERCHENGRRTLRGTVRDETSRKRAALRLQLSHDIARHLAADGEIESAVSHLLGGTAALLGWDVAVCWTMSNDGQVRALQSWTSAADLSLDRFAGELTNWSGAPLGTGLAPAWTSGESSWRTVLASPATHERERLARDAGMRTALVVPVNARRTIAALEFFSRSAVPVDRDVLGFAESVASQLAQYLQRKEAEQALRHLAAHDPLTGLANRPLLHERLAQAIKRAARHRTRLAVLFLDLDRFKYINDSLGHTAGDAVLRTCARRLTESVRDTDTVARFGGDEFVLVLEDLNQASDAVGPVTKLLARCAEPFVVNDRELPATASIGISVYPEDGHDVETLLMNADTAMYRAKDRGRSTYHFYSSQMNAHGQAQLELQSSLRRALERGEISLVYQPKLDLRKRSVTGVEALMRWQHPTLGPVSPAQFIPLAEETGLIESLGRWALQTACRDAVMWRDAGMPVQVSVNLSPRQLNLPHLATEVSQILADSGLEPGLLELEITESGVMQNPARAASLLQEVRALGVSLAIDDFGTGYSSLSYLQRFPLSTLKIDRSFIKDLPGDADAASLTSGIVGLAQRLRMKVVAEGVETVEQLGFLRAQGCDLIQGYYLSKPIPAEEMSGFLARDLRNLVGPTVAA
ncbi:EAL domain-containing protein [Caldimonas brevitalea]|uniref:Diguanylate cyclase/phosphodiesterase n=1 Tax=Caldimonas brevitalea TaxID=413882 RepID=A0A0G3BEX8_9BURK|nr:EAL domain-containing protein [Caldimonas brevitalea]AKJ27974.1 diguanylate cyclase/phosphodiesterase [Caldimonas brevitalea]